MIAISLGWGVQSFTLAAMSALGELETVDVAIHADTTHERKLTYEFATRWTPWLEERGVRVVTVEELATYIRQHPEHSRSFALRLADVLELAESAHGTKYTMICLLADGYSIYGRGARQEGSA